MDGGLIEHVRTAGSHLERRLRALALQHPVIEEVRGTGLMQGLQLHIDATPIVDLARESGLLVNRTDEKVVRLLPALTIEVAEIDRGIDILHEVFATVGTEVHA
jgi:acetylornithine/succinyldiaminopimelate/putrescine aminotransferase